MLTMPDPHVCMCRKMYPRKLNCDVSSGISGTFLFCMKVLFIVVADFV